MKLLTDDACHLKRIETDPNKVPTSHLYLHGHKTAEVLKGAYLEACILVDIYYLMIFSDPTTPSSTLYLHLLDIDYSLPLRETVRIDSTDSAAQFHSLGFQEPHSIRFHYGANTTYTVHISGRMKFSLAHYGRTDGIQQTNPYYLSITKQGATSEKSK